MKILYFDPVVETAISSNYRYYDGIYKQLIKKHQVGLIRDIPDNIQKICERNNFQANFVVFGLGWFNNKYFSKIDGINIPSICILFKPQNDLEEKLIFCQTNKIDLLLTPNPEFDEYERTTGVKSRLLPYGFDPGIFFDRKLKKTIDVGFSGALHENKHYPNGAFLTKNIRTKIGNILKNRNDINTFWSSSDKQLARIPSYDEYAKKINTSKIWIATQAAFGDITPRYYEIAASGTLLFCQKIPKQYKHIFKDGENCVEFDHNLSDFEKKMDYYLKNEEERNKIIENAYNEFVENHTWKNRAQQLIKHIEELS